MPTRPYELSLLNWQLSVFWAFAGCISLATCASTTNRRIRAEAERLEMQRQKVDLLEQVVRLKQQERQQDRQLQQLRAVLTGRGSSSSSSSWWGWRQPAALQQQLQRVLQEAGASQPATG